MAEHNIIVNADDFPGNSNRSKEELAVQKREKIVKGKVEKHRPSFFRKAASVIFSDVSEEDIRTELIFDYLVPTIKDTVVDMGKMLLDAIFYGSTHASKKSSGNKPYKVSYSEYYDRDKRQVQTSNKASSYNFDEITLNSRADAERVLDMMIDIIREYSQASVGDFLDLVGIDNNFTDYKYGWTDLTKVTISRVHGGDYVINFPAPTKLD